MQKRADAAVFFACCSVSSGSRIMADAPPDASFVKIPDAKPPRLRIGKNDLGNEIAGDDEKYVDADIAPRNEAREAAVERDYQQDRDCP